MIFLLLTKEKNHKFANFLLIIYEIHDYIYLSISLQLFPVSDKSNKLILNVRTRTIGHFYLLEI